MSPYSRAQRVSAWVASRLAMNEVTTKGSPRGPGGRRGANVGAVADMSRSALWETGAMIPQGALEGLKVPASREWPLYSALHLLAEYRVGIEVKAVYIFTQQHV